PTRTGGRTGGTRPPKPKKQKGTRSDYGVTLADGIAAGSITPPLRLFRKYKGRLIEAELLPDASVVFQGQNYPSCSTAAEFARGTVTGRRMNTNGWVFWQYQDAEGKRRTLDEARQRLIKAKQQGE